MTMTMTMRSKTLESKAYTMLFLCCFLALLPQLTQANHDHSHNHNDADADAYASNNISNSDATDKRILQPRIIGGTDAEQGQYPYMVSIVANSGAHDCGGVLVAKDVVLTAAHCSGKLARVHVGRWNRRFQFLGDQFDDIGILKEYLHPLFEGKSDSEDLNYDFALIKLDGSSRYAPIRINDKFFVPNTNQALTALGFGQTLPDDGSSEATILQHVDLKFIPNEQCSLSSDGLDSYEGLISEAMMCAADEGKDACFGDSGGPLVARNLDSQPVDDDPTRTADVLVGLTSWGFGCADANFPGVYARVSNQIGWLTETLCQISDDPPNEYYNCPTFAKDGNVPVVVKLTLDDYPSETAWQITCNNDIVYGQAALGRYGNRAGQAVEEKIFVPAGASCTFAMKDQFGDGLCCNTPGSFQLYLYNDPSQVFASGGGNYGQEATYDFTIPADADSGAVDPIIGDGTIPLTVSLLFDDFPEEVGWQVDRIGIFATTVYNFPPGSYRTPNGRAIQTVMLQDNQIYRFKIYDFQRDGMPGGTIQVLLGTMDVNERDKAILERRGGDMKDFFEVTFTSWETSNQAATDPPAVGSGEAFLTIALGFDLYPQEIGWQLRVLDRSLIGFSRTEEEDGEIVAFRPIGFYSDRARETVFDQVAIPQLPPNGEREFIFIITDEHGDGMCCDWGNELVEPGYSIYEGEASAQNLILSSKMKDTNREIKYFDLPSESKEPASTSPPTPGIAESSAVNLEISLALRGGSSSFYIEDAATGNRVVNYPCNPNEGTTRTYSIPSGVYTFAISNDCGKVGSVSSEMEYAVKLQGAGSNRPPLLQGSKPGTDTFVVWGEEAQVETMEMSLEFTTSSDPSSLNYYIKRLDVPEDDAFLAQVAKFSLEPNRYYIQSLSIQKGGLYRVALEGVTESALVNSQVMLKIGDKSYPIIFPGLRPSEEQYIKFLAGSLPSVSTDGPSLMLRIIYDNDPLDLEYVLFEETGSGNGGDTATSRAASARKMTRNRIYAFGPQDETLVSGLAGQEHIEILPLPSYAGEKTFTLLLSDSGGDGLCCKQGNGGPIELFDGPIENDNLLFKDAFSGTSRQAFTFTRQGEATASSSSCHAPLWGTFVTSFALIASYML